ncbi:tumor necrosis factor receptor superfamily member 14-like [Gadus chalcogrammus]|uniref:tumor necrosis factor receptor superfamily member 14-like n=1 Tax=Gadus chalcogrammus TaxID=1042646 RepID=UPI0024C2821A|nr:tumor necrosis factor receptor superfamily member 14-like [Gadus chalcogrammus]
MIEAQTNLTNMFLTFMLICSVFNTFNVAIAAPIECRARNEYLAGTECCPECPPGWYLVKDCTHGIITKCSTCPNGTFQAGHTKERQCSACKKCDAGLGRKVKKSCTSKSDAECEVLDGFFCSDSNGGGCRTAQRHRLSCSPGQYIGQRGTADKDTECLHCTDGTFSDGTVSSCQPHTTCDSVGGVQIQPGTNSTDSTCIHYDAMVLIPLGCISLVLISQIVLTALVYRRRKKDTRIKDI